MRATISERRETKVSAENQIAVSVQLTVSTFPEDHLRWIFTAKADAKARRPVAEIEPQVLEAAIADAARAAMAEIDRPAKRRTKR